MAIDPRHLWAVVVARLSEPRDAAGLAAFRILFGSMMCFGSLRFLWNGWVDRFFVKPDYFFSYWGFEWVQPLGPTGMHAVFVAMAVLSAMIAVGWRYRFATVAFAALFTYVELIDVTNYLNHYYFVSLVAVILAFLPANAMWSLDARRDPRVPSQTVPRFAYTWLKVQVAVVWVGAALAKFTPDWLLHAQPLNIWMNARVDTPVLGQFMDIWEVALLASWAGLLYDLTIPLLLLWKRTRVFAFVGVLGFHLMTHVWFAIGMFPLIMIVSATIFFEPDWPRRLLQRVGRHPKPSPDVSTGHARTQVHRFVVGFAVLWCALQLLMPLRSIAYGGNVLWHEQGMRWSWKVMCREKNGAVTLRVRLPSADREFEWTARQWLTDYQEREMAGQPDMILRLAHDVADHWRQQGHADVEVRADAIASLNGRAPKQLIDPTVDLADEGDGLERKRWILEAPDGPPPKIGRRLFDE